MSIVSPSVFFRHLAKSIYAESSTQQSQAECSALSKSRHSAKTLFAECQTHKNDCRSAKMATGDGYRPAIKLWLVLAVRRLAKIFFCNFFAECRVPSLALSKDFNIFSFCAHFFLCNPTTVLGTKFSNLVHFLGFFSIFS
jgi:hypothetical protein